MAGTEARGAAVIDVLVSVAVMLTVASVALPVVGGAMDRARAAMGARHLAGLMQRARFEALRRGTSVAIRFDQVGAWATVELVADGNGNGVLQRDIDGGIDWSIAAPDRIDTHARGVTLRINQGVPDVGGAGPLPAGSDPLRIGRTSLLTFGPAGTATAGTVYVAGEQGPQLAVRVFGATGRVRVLQYEAASGQWQP